ncbi:universal stress protein [Amycolatopsis thermophila]|uniref:Nucleotide-binding universal stress UspA family protein n=1 Tax=Amycolatopsis thermophila TaxID=206084 RepID=A0ABU0F0P8_9PSEU|nr:universal stress protein [Amycolatopsis thermophila]MDQ0381073.1 nucleotide-binding universal stress UspA family protein [Amycolatopsis thermophila]
MSEGQNAIVVGVDGSEDSLRAVGWAARVARTRREPLHVVHAFAPLTGLGNAGLPVLREAYDALVQVARGELAKAVRAAGEGVAVTSEMPNDPPVPALVERSRRARMLVLGASGAGGFSGMLAGSTTVAVSAHAVCPVAVIRGRDTAEGPVAVGVDGSAAAERALEIAFEEACWRGVPLVAVHSWLDTDFGGYPGTVPFLADWDDIERDEQRLLAEQLAGWQEKYPDVQVERVVVRDRPRHQLLSWSTRAQLVVAGTRGRGGFAGLLLGSTSQALIHHAQCPVLITPAVRP